jgi:hypothetical protein
MIVDLRRAVTPADMAELSCGVCAETFVAGPVLGLSETRGTGAELWGLCRKAVRTTCSTCAP